MLFKNTEDSEMNNFIGLLVGGLIPAFVFGVGALFQKYSNDIGIGQVNYLFCFSAGICICALIAESLFNSRLFSIRAGLFAAGHGLFFGIGFVCLALGITYYREPISKLVPLVNMSTLVTVIFGLLIFSEYTRLNTGYLLLGSILIVLGGILVSRA